MTDSEKRTTELVDGTPDQHADVAAPAYKRARQERINRHWVFYAVVLLGGIGYAIYRYLSP